MKVTAVVSTKGGPGKTTVGVNLGAFCADAGIRTLLIDLDNQPSLSSFYALSHEAPGGTYQLIANNETRADQVISHTCIPNLSLIHSNDPFNQLGNLLLHAADGRLRLKNLLPAFEQDFDLILIDTQGARSIVLEMVLLGAHMAISPITPDMLTAREFQRGMLQLYRDLEPLAALGAVTPMLNVVINKLDATNDANLIYHTLTETFADHPKDPDDPDHDPGGSEFSSGCHRRHSCAPPGVPPPDSPPFTHRLQSHQRPLNRAISRMAREI